MKKIFICSPLRGNTRLNIFNAEEYSREVALSGDLPITPHIYFTRFLSDDIVEERRLGIDMGIELLKLCDEVNVYGCETEGMRQEIGVAKDMGKKINYKKCGNKE